MTEQRHTRGPWRMGENDSEVFSPDGALVAVVYADTTSSRRANAHVIIAAPEMLAALNALRAQIPVLALHDNPALREADDKARAIIAKAEGRANG